MSRVQQAMRVTTVPIAVIIGLVGAGLTFAAFTEAADPPGAPERQSLMGTGPASQEQQDSTRARSRQEQPPAQQQSGVPDRITGLVLPESEPMGVSIPRLGVTSNLVNLTLNDSGGMEVPVDPAAAGWYALGPSPGALGPAVIAGHVTWDEAPAVFFELETLQRGDVVNVTREDGETAIFSVQSVRTFAKNRFPTRRVFGAIDHAGLRLITCGGTYDHAAHRYLDNVVVFATLVDVRPAEA
jgi:sortase (surface protein transpeptidase)